MAFENEENNPVLSILQKCQQFYLNYCLQSLYSQAGHWAVEKDSLEDIRRRMASGEVVFGYAALSCWECSVFGGFLFVCFWLLLVFVVVVFVCLVVLRKIFEPLFFRFGMCYCLMECVPSCPVRHTWPSCMCCRPCPQHSNNQIIRGCSASSTALVGFPQRVRKGQAHLHASSAQPLQWCQLVPVCQLSSALTAGSVESRTVQQREAEQSPLGRAVQQRDVQLTHLLWQKSSRPHCFVMSYFRPPKGMEEERMLMRKTLNPPFCAAQRLRRHSGFSAGLGGSGSCFIPHAPSSSLFRREARPVPLT
ncbi:hypothetical protein EK904_000604, partial [Melospiza melodia maxima]